MRTLHRLFTALALALGLTVAAGAAAVHATTYDFNPTSCSVSSVYNGSGIVGGVMSCPVAGMGGVTPWHHYRVMIICRNSETGAQTGWLYGNTGGNYPSNNGSSRFCPSSSYTLAALTYQMMG